MFFRYEHEKNRIEQNVKRFREGHLQDRYNDNSPVKTSKNFFKECFRTREVAAEHGGHLKFSPRTEVERWQQEEPTRLLGEPTN